MITECILEITLNAYTGGADFDGFASAESSTCFQHGRLHTTQVNMQISK